MKQNYSLNNTFRLVKVILLCSLFVNIAFGQVNKTTSTSENKSLAHPAATAQEMNTRPAEMSRTAKSASTSSRVEQSALNPELKELGIKINLLLNQARTLLADASNKQWFSENLQSNLRNKSAQVCPNVHLLELMMGDESFVCAPNMEKQELLYVIDFLNVSINGMLTK
jgi:hypothetical protein